MWAFLLPIIILGGIFGGVVTATEGAALAVVAALFIGFAIYRSLDFAHLRRTIIDGGVQTAIVMLLVATSALLGTYLTEVQAPQALARAVAELTANKWVVLALLNVLFLLLGMFLHSAAAIILVVPVVMPLVRAVGIDPIHFGLVVTINLGIGQQTPPVASVLLVASSIAKETIWSVTRVNVWFVGVLLAVLMLVTYVPAAGLALVHSSTGSALVGRAHRRQSRRRRRDDRPRPSGQAQRADARHVAGVGRRGPATLRRRRRALHRRPRRGRECVLPRQRHRRVRAVRANKAQAIAYGAVMHETASALAACRHPLVAQIHGVCVGGGLEIAALCDLRICGEGSRFGAPIKNLGLVMAYAEMAPLVRLVGPAIALEILLEGRIFGAAEALARAWSRASCPMPRWGRSTATVARIVEGAPLVARWHKQFARRLADRAAADGRRARRMLRLLRHRGFPRGLPRRSSPSASRDFAAMRSDARRRIPARSPACACSSSRRSWRDRPAA